MGKDGRVRNSSNENYSENSSHTLALLVWWCVSLRDLLCAAAAAVVDSGRRVFGMVLRELVLCGCREEDVCKV